MTTAVLLIATLALVWRLRRTRRELADAHLRDALRRLELADTDAALAEAVERLDRMRPDPVPWWERAGETEGGCPL